MIRRIREAVEAKGGLKVGAVAAGYTLKAFSDDGKSVTVEKDGKSETWPLGKFYAIFKKKEGAGDGSLDDRMSAVCKAVEQKFGGLTYAYPKAVFDDYVIVSKDSKLFRVSYTLGDDGVVSFGDDVQEVKVTYSPLTEGSILGPLDDDGRLVEAGATPSGKQWAVLIIQEGMSKNRNRYGAKTLKEAAPLYEGARIFMDHEESPRRFGRSTKDVAGFLKNVRPMTLGAGTQEAADEGGRFALAATACITNPAVRETLLDAWELGKPDLFGLSHDVKAESVAAIDADGRAFYDVTRIESVDSVDFVTNPAAGGRLVRLVASNTVADSLEGDERMLKKLIEAIRTSGRSDLVAKLDALGAEPNEDQVLALYQEAVKPAPAPAPTPSPAPTPAPVQEATAAASTARIQEADILELRRDAATLFAENTLNGVQLPDPVKAVLRKRFAEQIASDTIPAKAAITAAVKEQVDLFGVLADQKIVVQAGGPVITTKDQADKIREALDDFFDPKKPMTSFRSLYIDITGDRNITGRTQEAKRLTEALNTASWAEILGDSITRRMLKEYAGMVDLNNWRGTVAEVVPVSDFRTQRRMRFGGYGNLATVGQGAPYLAMASPTDEEATYAPAKRGGTESVTIEMIANDDVGAVRRIPTRMARAAAQTLHEFVWDFLATNGLIYDGAALAVAGHGNNLIATALTASNLAVARRRIKDQTDMSSGKKLGLAARYLIVPNDLEELAFQLTTSDRVVPDTNIATTAQAAAPNFLKKLNLSVIVVDYWTDADNYWVTASPDQAPMIEVGFLAGREEPELFVQDTPNQGSLFSNDQITYKIRHVYGGAVLDYRPFVGGIVP